MPIFLSILLIIISFISPQNIHDQFFSYKNTLDRETIIKRLEYLEEINQKNYGDEKKKINGYFADNKLTDHELTLIEKIIINRYFDKFNKRWIAFRRSPFMLKTIFLLSLLNGFVVFGLILFLITEENVDPDWWAICLYPIGLFPMSLIIGFLFLGVLSMFFTVLTFFTGRGSIIRISLLLDELLKSLKPGGRNTAISFPNVESDMIYFK